MELLSVDAMTRAAIEAVAPEDIGEDFGEDGWQEGLERLAASLRDEAGLNELGVGVANGELVGYLTTRLQLTAARAADPSIAAGTITAPIFIVGQGRTGTTILHDLLAQDPQMRVPRAWEVDRPLPAPETETYETDPRVEEVDAGIAMIDLVLPGFRGMHAMGARLAQECVRITALDFRSMQFPTQYRLPSYTRWLLGETDMSTAYRWHRRFLQHLQSRHPQPHLPRPRWVLKSPGHIWALEALMREYPDALLVQTHRDPLRIIASVSSLVSKLRSLGTGTESIPLAASEFADYIIDGVDRSVDARESGLVPGDRVVDVQFKQFMANPFVTIAAIYDRLGLTLPSEAEQGMRTFLADNPPDKHGGHRYTFAATNLDEQALRVRTERYEATFNVPQEPLST